MVTYLLKSVMLLNARGHALAYCLAYFLYPIGALKAMFFSPLYLLLLLGPALLGAWASYRTKTTFTKYSQKQTSRGITGAQVAQAILERNNISNVTVESVQGFLSDHYDSKAKVLRLSPDVYNGHSMAALGVAAHEVGHAIQDATNYSPLQLRSNLVPAVGISSNLGSFIIMGSFMLGGAATAFGAQLAWIGLFLFGMGSVFALVTLPVEFDASKRALETLKTGGFVSNEELGGAKKVLDAAALTYVAAAVAAIASVLMYAIQLGLFNSRSRDE
jgi:uncharacterized protein